MQANQLQPEATDRAIVERFLRRDGLPKEVISYRIVPEEDSSGDPAFRVYVKVKKKALGANSKKFDSLRRFMSNVQHDAIQSGISRWPFIEFVGG